MYSPMLFLFEVDAKANADTTWQNRFFFCFTRPKWMRHLIPCLLLLKEKKETKQNKKREEMGGKNPET